MTTNWGHMVANNKTIISHGCPGLCPDWNWLLEACSLPGCAQVLDTTRLLRSCVQSAVGMLRDQNESCARSTRRVTILLGLLNEDNARSGE